MTDQAPKDTPQSAEEKEAARIAANKAFLTSPIERVEVGPPSVDEAGKPIEHGGRDGLEPTRYGDWEHKGLCVDF